MAKLRAKARNSLPDSAFGLPGSRRYPVDTVARAKNAKARAAAQVNKGNLSKSSQSKINAKANKKLRGKKK